LTDSIDEQKQFDEMLTKVGIKLEESGQDLDRVGRVSRRDLMTLAAVVAKQTLSGFLKRERDAMAEHILEIQDHIANEFINEFKRLDRVFEQNVEIVAQMNTHKVMLESQQRQLQEIQRYLNRTGSIGQTPTDMTITGSKRFDLVGSNEAVRVNSAKKGTNRIELEGGR
jgi:hypothetical protein